MVRSHGDPVFHRGWSFLRYLVYFGVVLLRRNHERHGPDVLLAPSNCLERGPGAIVIIGVEHASASNIVLQA